MKVYESNPIRVKGLDREIREDHYLMVFRIGTSDMFNVIYGSLSGPGEFKIRYGRKYKNISIKEKEGSFLSTLEKGKYHLRILHNLGCYRNLIRFYKDSVNGQPGVMAVIESTGEKEKDYLTSILTVDKELWREII